MRKNRPLPPVGASVSLVATQVCHAWGLSIGCFGGPARGSTMIVQRLPPNDLASIADMASSIERFRVPFVSITPWSLHVIARRNAVGLAAVDLSSVRTVICAGGSMPAYQMRRLRKYFPAIRLFYGSTEVCH